METPRACPSNFNNNVASIYPWSVTTFTILSQGYPQKKTSPAKIAEPVLGINDTLLITRSS